MADRMEFPKTIQEFMDGYSFKDDKEVYTNGSRLIPTFRVEQALEHYGQAIRNKAIDEFANELKKHKFHSNERYENCVPVCQIDWIAQQLKAGGTDGSERADT